jgi:PAS domain S-box-containing protein
MNTWVPAPRLLDEVERQQRLAALGLGEGQRHDVLDTLTALASGLLGAPIALVTLVEADRQRFASRHGIDATSTGRAESFCGHCIATQRPLVVDDSDADPRFAGGPLVAGAPYVRAYLGVPLFAAPGQSAIGTLCAVDHEPRHWTKHEQAQLERLAALAEHYLESLTIERVWEDSPLAMVVLDATGRAVRVNPAFGRMLGRPTAGLHGRQLASFVVPEDRGVLHAMVSHALTHRESPTRRELRFEKLSGERVSGGVSVSILAEPGDQVVCVIRDISLERRLNAQSGVVAAVRGELGGPLSRAREVAAEVAAGTRPAAQMNGLLAALDEFDAILDARVGDIAARVRAEAELQASEQRLRVVLEDLVGPLVVIDDRGRIVDANVAALHALGHAYEALVGASLRIVCPSFTDEQCARWFGASPRGGARLAAERDTFVRSDGSERSVELQFLGMDWNGPGRLVLLVRDVTADAAREETLRRERDDLAQRVRTGREALTEQQRMEEALRASVAEKETLLKEIHHRVKNNLQMVSSLLTLQLDQMPDERGRALLLESVRRVRSMALIHQHLYGSLSLERIDLGAYARDLSETLRQALAPAARVAVDVESVEITVDRAAPVCLILNELLTNAFKYGAQHAPGAPDDPQRGADVAVVLRVDGRKARLTVRDGGPGLPPDFDVRTSSSLGLQLVTTLTRQLRGRLETRNADGAVFELEFPV